MEIQYKDFIGIYSNVYPEGYCEHLISVFETLKENGAGSTRAQSENARRTMKDDYQIFLSLKGQNVEFFEGKSPVDMFFNGLQSCFEDYTNTYAELHNASLSASIMKMQRTDPGGGYHIWHSENLSLNHSNRVLVYLLYLNTLEPEQAGETEFLYQRKRFAPVKNTMLIWPAAYTHTHRGNTVFGDSSKYIVTGWFHIN